MRAQSRQRFYWAITGALLFLLVGLSVMHLFSWHIVLVLSIAGCPLVVWSLYRFWKYMDRSKSRVKN